MYAKINISIAKKAYTALFILGCFLTLSIGLAFIHWYLFFIPFLFIFSPEIVKYSKALVRSKIKPMDAVVSEPKLLIESTIFKITSIADWFIKDYIQCSFYDNYGSIGTGAIEKLKAKYYELVTQYYDARADEDLKYYIDLMKERIRLTSIIGGVRFNAALLSKRYSDAAIIYMRKEIKDPFPQYQYTEKTYQDDIKNILSHVDIIEAKDLGRVEKKIEKYLSGKITVTEYTAQQKHEHIIDLILEISNSEGIKYDLEKLTMLELARLENRYGKKIKLLQEQAKRNGRSN